MKFVLTIYADDDSDIETKLLEVATGIHGAGLDRLDGDEDEWSYEVKEGYDEWLDDS